MMARAWTPQLGTQQRLHGVHACITGLPAGRLPMDPHGRRASRPVRAAKRGVPPAGAGAQLFLPNAEQLQVVQGTEKVIRLYAGAENGQAQGLWACA